MAPSSKAARAASATTVLLPWPASPETSRTARPRSPAARSVASAIRRVSSARPMTPTSGRMCRRSGRGIRRLATRADGARDPAKRPAPGGSPGRANSSDWSSTWDSSWRSSSPGSSPSSSMSVRAHPAEGGQGIGLAAAPVEGDHQLGPEPLAQRVGGHQALELGHHLGVTAQGQVGVDPQFQRLEAAPVEALGLGGGKEVVGEVGQRLPPPQIERLTQALIGGQRDRRRPARRRHRPPGVRTGRRRPARGRRPAHTRARGGPARPRRRRGPAGAERRRET